MGHSYNHGLVTSMKGAAIESARITAMNTGTCTIAEQCGSGLLRSVTIAAGILTFQLAGPLPPKLVTVQLSYSTINATTAFIYPRYVQASYNATTGQFQVALSTAVPAAAAPAAADELHVTMIFKRYTGIGSV